MGGLGKTALAQSIYTHHNMTNSGFELKLWVCVSEEFDLKVIIQKMIESATGTKPKPYLQIDSLQSELRKKIDGKKYLFVMDDVWNEKKEEWLRLKRLLMGGAKGSRILITTRSEQVAKTFDSTFIHFLQILDEYNSWLLFQKITCLEGHPSNPEKLDQSSSLIQIGREIVSKLKGVPLTIRTIGGLLKDNKSKRVWLSFKDNELHRILGQGQDNLKEVRLILELSYKYLPANLKQCFLYCALFPKDYEIKTHELILMWSAQGFIQPNGSKDNSLIDIGNDYFMELLSRSFFQEVTKNERGDIIACKMHDLMHDLACWIADNECNVINIGTRHFSWKDQYSHKDQLLRSLSKVTNLRTFFMLDSANDLKWEFTKILHDHLQLRALYFKNLKNAMIVLEFTGKLKHLRYLSIMDSFILNLPDSITELYNLETLILRNSSFKMLPDNIGNLINLKHLDLSNNRNLKFLPDSISDLCKLEELILHGCLRLEEFPEDTKKLINLKHLSICGCLSLTYLPKRLGELSDLQILRFQINRID